MSLPRPRRPRSTVRLVALAGLAVVLAGCAQDAPRDSLDPAGPLARTLDNLFMPVFWVAVVVFVFVEGLVLFVAFKFRRRPGDDEVPAQVHGNTRLEVGWTILPALVLAVVAVPTVAVLFQLYEQPSEESVQVDVVGQQWWWEFEYPGTDVGGDGGPVTTANEIHIPAGTPVELTMTSRDVIHSFWAPRLNGKRDVVPGRAHYWKIEADEPGVFDGQCAEFCGASHANMYFKVVAHSPEDYDDWLEGMQREPTVPTSGAAAEGHALFAGRACSTCHVVDGQYEDQVLPESPAAPNLTKLFSRECFAGCSFELDRNNLEAWLRNPPGQKPGSLMPNLNLTEQDIDALYAYLETLR